MARQLLGGAAERHAELKRKERADASKRLRDEEHRKKEAILQKANDARKDSGPLVQHDSKSQLKGTGPNISNFKASGIDLNKGGGWG